MALYPLCAINWTSRVLSVIGCGEIRILLRRLRSDLLGQQAYKKLHAHFAKSLIPPDMITPREWGIRTDLIGKFNLYEDSPLPT